MDRPCRVKELDLGRMRTLAPEHRQTQWQKHWCGKDVGPQTGPGVPGRYALYARLRERRRLDLRYSGYGQTF
jgi:hypothetical protein